MAEEPKVNEDEAKSDTPPEYSDWWKDFSDDFDEPLHPDAVPFTTSDAEALGNI